MDNSTAPLTNREIEALARRIDRPIVLVGMMGVGKTSVGKRLAAALGSTFVDAVEAIETAARMTIPEIFEQYGEAAFRDGERRVIARLIEQGGKRSVIATGGGAISNPETRAQILERTIAVWLDSDIDTLVERTARKNNRPLLQNGDRRETLTRLHAEREGDYAQAHIHVMSDLGPQTRTVDTVLKGIAEWL